MSKELTQEEILNAMGWYTVCHSPHEIEHKDGSTATGLATQAVIDSIIEEYHLIKKEEAELAEEDKKAEATKGLVLEDINGAEILEFLNDQIDNSDELCDISLCGELEFENQEIGTTNEGESIYVLTFTAYYNNWGELESRPGNEIQITNDSVMVIVDEAFEGDGSDTEIEDVLREWLKTHKFQSRETVESAFNDSMSVIKSNINNIGFSDINDMDELIEELTKIRTLMK